MGEMCPECGCDERKLLMDGTSWVMTWLAVILGLLVLMSFGTMLVNIVHVHLFPNVQGDWLRETTKSIRAVLRPGLMGGAFVVVVLSYLVIVWDAVHNKLTRVRLLQFGICIGVCVLAGGVAWGWGS